MDFPSRLLATAAGLLLAAGCVYAQSTPEPAPAVQPTQPPVQAPEDKRVFGVLPNNRTTEASIPFAAITAQQKLTIAFKDSFDWPVYPTAGLFAALYQLENQNPSFGQGMEGYARRLVTAYADQLSGNMLTEGFIPALTHEDPRYFRLGAGTRSTKGRAWYAVSRIFVTKTDSGHTTFNLAEWGGNAAAVALSNAYYPDTRNVNDNVQKLMIQCATDAFSNVLKEFWPDVKRKFFTKNKD